MGLLDLRSLEESDNSVTGTIGVDYLYDDVTGALLLDDTTDEPIVSDDATLGAFTFGYALAASGAETITGTAATAFGFSVAAVGTETVTGTGAVAFAFSEAATGTERFTGTGAVAFSFSESGSGTETLTGTGASAFGFSLAASGAETISGAAAEAFGFALGGSGTSITGDTTGTGGVAFGFSLDATGHNDSIVDGHAPKGAAKRHRPYYVAPQAVLAPPEPLPVVTGAGGISFGFALTAAGNVNDDDLVLALAA